MRIVLDHTGDIFGKWTVLGFSHTANDNKKHWLCRCECGMEKPVSGTELRLGRSTQCSKCALKRKHEKNRRTYTYECRCCGKTYIPKAKDRNKYCSRECAYLQRRIIAKRKKIEREKYEKLYPKRKHPRMSRICIVCSKDFKGNHNSLYCSDICRKQISHFKQHEQDAKARECKFCGKVFIPEHLAKTYAYCCEEHKDIAARESRHAAKRRRRFKSNGRVDNGISLEKLIKRDKGICHICGEKIDTQDYRMNDNSLFIAGNNYPSIDHVIARANGGTHTWDNVKLAHRICNSIKSDKAVYKTSNGQLLMAM